MKINRHSIHSGLLALAISALAISSSLAQMNYQGRLTDANGNNLANGQYTIEFRLFNEAGVETWGPYTTDGTAANGKGPRVDLVDGRFNTVIGNLDTTSRKFSDGFNGEEKRYLQIKVGNNPAITPRQLLLPAPIAAYATKAKTAESAQSLSNGSGASPLNVDFTNGRVGVGTTTPSQKLDVNGNAQVSGKLMLPNTSAGGAAGLIQLGSSHIHSYGTNNLFAGNSAGNFTMTGSDNVGIGRQALINNTTANENTAIGHSAMESNSTGANNTGIGRGALLGNTIGSDNIALGRFAGSQLNTGSNNIAIANSGAAGASNTIWLGTEGTHTKTILAGNVGIGTTGSPGAKLDVNGDVIVQGTINGEFPPFRFEMGSDTGSAQSVVVESDTMEKYMGDGDGCRIRYLFRRDSNDELFVEDQVLYCEPRGIGPSLEAGLRGVTKVIEGTDRQWILDTASKFLVSYAAPAVNVRNFDFGGNEAVYRNGDKYKLKFTCTAGYSATVIIYDN